MSDQGPGNSKSQSNFDATEEQLARIRARGDPFVVQDDNEPLSSPPLDLDYRPSEEDSSALQGPQQGDGLFDQFPNPEPDIFSSLGLDDPTQASSSLADPIQASSSLADPTQASSSLADPTQASSSLADPTQASSSLADPTQASGSLAVDPSDSEPIPTTGHNARQHGGRWLVGILNPSQAASNEQSQGSGPALNTSAQQPTPQSTSKTPHGLPATSGTAATPATQGPAQPLSKENRGQKKVPDFWEVYLQRAPGTGAITGVLSEAAMELAFSLPTPSNTGVDSDQEMEYAPALSPTVPTITIVEAQDDSDQVLDDREIEEVENLLRGRVDNTLSSRTPIQPLPNPDANIDPLLATLFPEHLRPSTSAPQGPGLELNESDESHDSLFDGPDDDDTSPMADRDPAEQTPDIPLQGGTSSRPSTSDGNNSLFNGTDDEPAAGSASGRDPANQSPDIPIQGGTSSRESTSDGNNSLFNGPDEEPEAGPTTGRDPANQSPDILIPGGTGSGASSSDGKNSLFDGSDDEPAVADPSSVSTASGALSRDNPPPPPAPRGPPLPHTTRDGLRLPGPGKPGASTVPAAAPLPSTTRPRRGVSPLPGAPSQNPRTASALPSTTRAAPQPYTTRDGLMLPGPGRRGVSPLPAAPSQNTRTASALPNTTRAAPQPFTTSDGLMLPGPGRRGVSPLPAAPSQNTRTASALPNTTRAAPQPFTTSDGLRLPGPGRRGVSPIPAAVPPTTQRTTRRTVTPQPPATTSQRVTEHQPQSSQLASNTTIPQPPAQSTSTQPAQSQQGPSQGQRVTKGPRGPCPICGKDLAISSHRSHLASVHGLKEKQSCKFCGIILRHAGDLPRHVRSKHPEIAARMAAGEKLRDLEPSPVHTNQTNQPTTNQSAGQGSSATTDVAVSSLSLDIPVDPRLSRDIPVPSLSLDIPVPSLSLDIPVPSLSLDIPVPSLVVPGGPATRRRSPRTTPAPEPIPGTSSLAPVASTSNAPPAKRARTRAQTQADDDNDPVNSKTKKGKGPAVEVSTTEDGSSVVTLRPKVTRKRNPEGTTKPRAGARQVQCPDCEEWGTFKNRNRHAANCAPRLLRIAAETPATQPLPQKKKVTCQICKKQLAGDLPRHMRSVHPQHPSVRWEEQEQDDDDEVDDPQQGSSNPKRKKNATKSIKAFGIHEHILTSTLPNMAFS
ncbi:hypothetical protein PGT21_014500 [Puccinia graminis f. sp. tritici]|uniref:C2H2-type domain-containing protein n=1 Tax=Puccinia graminis f. sp. tritici TaxID=56615 RepID=A0A5B0Q5D1_PUCGR|nr:hypothetical protein PGT21_014500 [Puccinia graminis f. sp. tritici]